MINNSLFAAELTLWQGVGTYHVDRTFDGSDNEENRISALFYDRWFVGIFKNSYSYRSELFGYNFFWNKNHFENWHLHYGIGFAVATGYREELDHHIEGHLTPGFSSFLGAKFNIDEQKKWGLDLLYIPTDDDGVFVLGLNLSMTLGD